MKNSIIFGILLAITMALTAPLASGAINTYGNSSANTTSIAITANTTITEIKYEGCTQVTYLPKLGMDYTTVLHNDTQVKYACLWNFTPTGGNANISTFQIPTVDNFTNISTVEIWNNSNTSSGAANNLTGLRLQSTSDKSSVAILMNFTFNTDYIWSNGVNYQINVTFYTNATTITSPTQTAQSDGYTETVIINHPSSGGLGISDINITYCPAYKTAMATSGGLVSVTFNGTSRTATTDGANCINLTTELNSTYEVAFKYRTQTATGTTKSGGKSPTAVTPISPLGAPAIGMVLVAIAIVIILIAGIVVWQYR